MSNAATERVRMALAEAGYPNARVRDGGPDGPAVDLADVPDRVCWKAQHIAQSVPDVPCFQCWCSDTFERCLAISEGVDDCGVDRNAS